jgi:hypothetical protein
MRFAGKLSDQGGAWYIPVTGEYTVGQTADGMGWSGWMRAKTGQIIPLADECILTLDDGKTGRLLIEDINASSTNPSVTHFKGSGPPPQ